MALKWMISLPVLAFFCEYIDSALGMGYGTTLTPILLIAGFAPLEVVPAVLLGQIAGGLVGGLAHQRVGNISLDFRRDEELIREKLRWLLYLPKSSDAKVVFVLVLCGIVGALVGVFSAVSIPSLALKAYIGAMVLAIGLLVVRQRANQCHGMLNHLMKRVGQVCGEGIGLLGHGVEFVGRGLGIGEGIARALHQQRGQVVLTGGPEEIGERLTVPPLVITGPQIEHGEQIGLFGGQGVGDAGIRATEGAQAEIAILKAMGMRDPHSVVILVNQPRILRIGFIVFDEGFTVAFHAGGIEEHQLWGIGA